MLDNDDREPDGNTATSAQAMWLRNRLAATPERWKIVVGHQPPYSSNGGVADAQWPYQAWGASYVVSGHVHNYERLVVGGMTYFVNGLGGEDVKPAAAPIAASRKLFDDDYGFMLVNADDDTIDLRFITRAGVTVDMLMEQDEAAPEPGAAAGVVLVVAAAFLRRRRGRAVRRGADPRL